MSTWKIHKDVDIYFITSSIICWSAIFKDKPFFSIIEAFAGPTVISIGREKSMFSFIQPWLKR